MAADYPALLEVYNGWLPSDARALDIALRNLAASLPHWLRDLSRLRMAVRGVDVIVHAAALKQVPACEYNPFEAVQTNIIGAENVVTAAIEHEVPHTVSLSTDKAVNPVNLYGATKLSAEKIVTQGNVYAGSADVRSSSVNGSEGWAILKQSKHQDRRAERPVKPSLISVYA